MAPDPEACEEIGFNQLFEDQEDAEEWMRTYFADILDADIQSVSLYEEDRLVYGPMPLTK